MKIPDQDISPDLKGTKSPCNVLSVTLSPRNIPMPIQCDTECGYNWEDVKRVVLLPCGVSADPVPGLASRKECKNEKDGEYVGVLRDMLDYTGVEATTYIV